MRRLNTLTVFISFIIVIFCIGQGYATEEYAELTGTDCEACHIDPLGGGDLTEIGKGYLLSISLQTVQTDGSKASISKLVKLLAGYIHIVTAFMWFGTILYVHLVLKPAYASKGLPRGEVRVGLVSMVVMALTGSILTYFKVPSLDLLVSSKFGILLLVKISVFAFMVASALVAVFIVGPKLKKKKAAKQSLSGEYTLAELASFDGEEGHPAYFAFKGKVYDVTQSKLWRNGNHMKRHQAGCDLTEIISQAPHDEDKILAMPEVGKLLTKKTNSPIEVPKKIFYFMAYMNLSFVFLITLILALWRWY